MNVLNNQRFQSTEMKIRQALFSLLKIRKYNDFSIKEICYEAGINRSSFYAHYSDINDLMIKTEQEFSNEIMKIFDFNKKWDESVFLQLFEFLYENRLFYKSYLQANEQTFMEKADFSYFIDKVRHYPGQIEFSSAETMYHMVFFAGGLKALSKTWILADCQESPEQMSKILMEEYKVNVKYFS